MNSIKSIENILFAYSSIIAEIRIIELEIERVENDYSTISAKFYNDEPKVQSSFGASSSVETSIILKEETLEDLQRKKRELEIAAEKVDSLMKMLSEQEYLFVTQYYFKQLKTERIAESLDVSENHVYKIRRRVLKKLCPVIKSLNLKEVG